MLDTSISSDQAIVNHNNIRQLHDNPSIFTGIRGRVGGQAEVINIFHLHWKVLKIVYFVNFLSCN